MPLIFVLIAAFIAFLVMLSNYDDFDKSISFFSFITMSLLIIWMIIASCTDEPIPSSYTTHVLCESPKEVIPKIQFIIVENKIVNLTEKNKVIYPTDCQIRKNVYHSRELGIQFPEYNEYVIDEE